MSAKAVVGKLCELAAKPENRSFIVKNQGCLPGLVLFLDDTDPLVSLLALQTLDLLAQCADNRPIMTKDTGLQLAIARLSQNGSDAHMALCAKLKQSMRGPVLAERNGLQALGGIGGISAAPADGKMGLGAFSSAAPKPSFIGAAASKSRTIVLNIEHYSGAAVRGIVEDALLKIRGVISFTFNSASNRVTLRVKQDLAVDAVFAAILASNDDIDIKQVVKLPDGTEQFIEPNISRENQPAVSGYLDEDDEYDEDQLKRTAISHKNSGRARRQRTDSYGEEESSASGGWLGSFGSYISKSIWG